MITRQTITLNVDRQVYREMQELCRQERRTLGELFSVLFYIQIGDQANW
jgi:hypothetical protein